MPDENMPPLGPAAQLRDEENAGPPEPLSVGIELHRYGGYAPVQAEGSFDGVAFYFRARWEHWSIEVGEDPPSHPINGNSWYYEESYGASEFASASWMVKRDAYAAINKAYHLWKNR